MDKMLEIHCKGFGVIALFSLFNLDFLVNLLRQYHRGLWVHLIANSKFSTKLTFTLPIYFIYILWNNLLIVSIIMFFRIVSLLPVIMNHHLHLRDLNLSFVIYHHSLYNLLYFYFLQSRFFNYCFLKNHRLKE